MSPGNQAHWQRKLRHDPALIFRGPNQASSPSIYFSALQQFVSVCGNSPGAADEFGYARTLLASLFIAQAGDETGRAADASFWPSSGRL
jgi:hypothetical protein